MHEAMAATLDAAVGQIKEIQQDARAGSERPRWPMIVLQSPKGWTGPKVVDGLQVEGTFRAHQVPIADRRGASRASQAVGGLAAQLPARGTLR